MIPIANESLIIAAVIRNVITEMMLLCSKCSTSVAAIKRKVAFKTAFLVYMVCWLFRDRFFVRGNDRWQVRRANKTVSSEMRRERLSWRSQAVLVLPVQLKLIVIAKCNWSTSGEGIFASRVHGPVLPRCFRREPELSANSLPSE